LLFLHHFFLILLFLHQILKKNIFWKKIGVKKKQKNGVKKKQKNGVKKVTPIKIDPLFVKYIACDPAFEI